MNLPTDTLVHTADALVISASAPDSIGEKLHLDRYPAVETLLHKLSDTARESDMPFEARVGLGIGAITMARILLTYMEHQELDEALAMPSEEDDPTWLAGLM